jgi:hypothetical protein
VEVAKVAISLQRAVLGTSTSISLTLWTEVSRLKECRTSLSKTTTRRLLNSKNQEANRHHQARAMVIATMWKWIILNTTRVTINRLTATPTIKRAPIGITSPSSNSSRINSKTITNSHHTGINTTITDLDSSSHRKNECFSFNN